LNGWRVDDQTNGALKRSVLLAAPHTSNWDAVYCLSAFTILKLPIKFTIKKEWLKGVLGWVIRPLGGLGIDINPKGGLSKRSMVDVMADFFKTYDDIIMIVTPEGTRSKRTEWKSGFYIAALKAEVPISLGYLDYDKRIAGIGKIFMPSGDFEQDMKMINDFYRDKTPKIPENFSLDLRYEPK
jgi:1-acyl-sn-glycerol-3-phosphate acyltransferase